MKKWRVAHRLKNGTVRDSGLKYWTRWGAMKAARRLNTSDSPLMLLVKIMGGENFFAVRVDELDLIK